MDYKKTKAPTNTITHNLMDFCKGTDNVYESIAIMAKRSNQISVKMKEDLNKKLKEFSSGNDNLEETFENLEQIEISKYYEKLPKPTLIAAEEFLNNKIYYRNPAKEKENLDD
jgi:DNA-directed RNA polymerase subunit K/omega